MKIDFSVCYLHLHKQSIIIFFLLFVFINIFCCFFLLRGVVMLSLKFVVFRRFSKTGKVTPGKKGSFAEKYFFVAP